MSPFSTSPLLSLPLIVACALGRLGPGHDDKYVLGKDDKDFALELARAGYPDLARDFAAAVERVRTDPAGKAEAELLRIDLDADLAQRERDVKKRMNLLLDVVKAKQTFGEAHKGTPVGDSVVSSLPDLYRSVGEAISTGIQNEQDPAEVAKLRTVGSELFEQAERSLNILVKDLQDKVDKQEPDPNPPVTEEQQQTPLEEKLMLAKYSTFRTYYFHGRLLEEGSADRTAKLKKAIDLFQEFQFDYLNYLPCYEGYVYEGMCNEDLGQPDKAAASFDSALKIRELFAKTPTGLWQLSREAADLVSWAVVQKMTLLDKQGKTKEAITAADEFFNTTPDAAATMKGLAILAAKADAQQKLGDQAGLEATAKKLIELDPNGAGGAKGRDLTGQASGGGGKGLGLFESLRLAEGAIGRGEMDLATSLCQQVIDRSRGTKDWQNASAQACLLLGIAAVQQKRMDEAVVAWETAYERFPKGDATPEALSRAVKGWSNYGQTVDRGPYKTRWKELLTQLLAKYPTSPQAASAKLIELTVLVNEGKFEDAAKAADAIPENSPSFGEAMYQAGDACAKQVRAMLQKDKSAAVKPLVDKAVAYYGKARAALEAAAKATLETSQQNRLNAYAFDCRLGLVALYLVKGVDRAADALPLLDEIEKQYASDPDKIAKIWSARIQTYRDLGKVDEAIAQLDAQIAKDPKNRAVPAAAGALGVVVDQRAQDSLKKSGPSASVDQQFQKAVRYYLLGVGPQIDGREPLRVEQVEQVADRLLALGLQFNAVPESVTSFVDWTAKRREVATWTEAAKLYEVVLPQTPSYRTLVHAAQTYGFLGKFKDAAKKYAELFDRERFVDFAAKKLDDEALRTRPELLGALVEYGYCARESGLSPADPTALSKGSSIFEAIVQSVARDSRSWWQAKYWQIQLMYDRGEYPIADVAIRSVKRGSENYDEGKFGYKDKFVALEAEITRKLPPTAPPEKKSPDGK
jgi:tetratricopeptide (TPR) repeat protein